MGLPLVQMCQNEFVKYEFYGMDEVYGRYPRTGYSTVQGTAGTQKYCDQSIGEFCCVFCVWGGGHPHECRHAPRRQRRRTAR